TRHRKETISETGPQGCVGGPPPVEPQAKIAQLTQPESRLNVVEPEIRAHSAILVRSTPLEITLVDERFGPIEHMAIGRGDRATLSGCHNLRHAERIRADGAECARCRSLIAVTERARCILNQWYPSLSAERDGLDQVRSCVT